MILIRNTLINIKTETTQTQQRKHEKKELGQYPAILTEQAWSITHTYYMASSASGQDEPNRAL